MRCFTLVRLMTVSFNLLISLSGLSLLAVGVWSSLDGSVFLQTLAPFSAHVTHAVNVGALSAAAGALLLLLGLLGGCGAHRESKCLLLMFFSIILVIFMAEVTAGVLVLVYSSGAALILRAWATPVLHNQHGRDPVATSIWNATMTELRCCGFNNYTDFVGSMFEEETGGRLPLSCCWSHSTACSRDAARSSGVQGCAKGILTTLRAHANIVGSIAAGAGILQVALMSMCMYLYFHLDHDDALRGTG